MAILALVGPAAIGVCAVLAGACWFLANRGLVRWLALILVIAAPTLIPVTFALHSLLWVAVLAVVGGGKVTKFRLKERRKHWAPRWP